MTWWRCQTGGQSELPAAMRRRAKKALARLEKSSARLGRQLKAVADCRERFMRRADSQIAKLIQEVRRVDELRRRLRAAAGLKQLCELRCPRPTFPGSRSSVPGPL